MKMDMKDVINDFVGRFFPLFSDPDLGLFFNIDARYDDWKCDPEFHYRFSTRLLITRPMNNARIYVQQDLNSSYILSLGMPFEMCCVSSHNSCWMDAVGEIFNNGESTGMEIYYGLTHHGNAWTAVSEYVSFHISQPPTFVHLKKREKIADIGHYGCNDCGGYEGQWRFEGAELLTTKEAAEYMNAEPGHYRHWR
jgi:hypothetical protein